MPVEVQSFGCESLAEVDPQGLGVTYWFDTPPAGEPRSFTLHVGGHLRGDPPPGEQGTFTRLATIEAPAPGSGPVAVTTRVFGLVPGVWDVTVTPVLPSQEGGEGASVTLLRTGKASGPTVFAPAARVLGPGVRLGAWPAFVGAGAFVGLAMQSFLAPKLGLTLQRLLPLSLVACLFGVLGAKTYFLMTHRRERRGLLNPGMSVQGFVLAAVAVLLGGSWALDLPVRGVLDVTAPGLLFGMMIGRFGCFLGGCCAGRPTRAWWGVWSSDRNMAVRRIPVQMLESLLAGLAGVLTLWGILLYQPGAEGLIFIAGIATYIAGRQVLFPLRSIPRATRHGRQIVLASSSLIAIAATAAVLLL